LTVTQKSNKHDVIKKTVNYFFHVTLLLMIKFN